MMVHSELVFGRESRNRLGEVATPGMDGARALIETFYYAFNQRDLGTFEQIWAEDARIQLNNPLGGMLRGHDAITVLYQRIFTGPARVWVEFSDIVEYQSEAMMVFAGRERGEFVREGQLLELSIRTSRVLQWLGPQTGWRQVHHHGSIDDPLLLQAYQHAVNYRNAS